MSKQTVSAQHIENGNQFMRRGQYEYSISEYTKAIEVYDQPFTHILRAFVYGILLGKPMEYFDQKTEIARRAMPDLDMCVSILKKSGDLPGFPLGLKDFYAQRATAHLYLEKPKKAADDMYSAIALDPQNAEFWIMIGGIHLDQLNDPTKAADDFKTAISIQPSADAYLFLAWTYIDTEDIEKAMMFIHVAAQMNMSVLDMERNHNDFKEHQWKMIRSNYIPYANRRR